MLRGLARGWKVAVVQFVKSGDWKVGEEKIGRQLGVDWISVGDGFTWDSERPRTRQGRSLARDGPRAEAIIRAGEHQLVILDELTYLWNWGWIDAGSAVESLRDRPATVSVIVTGRDAPPRSDRHRRHGDGDAQGQARLRQRASPPSAGSTTDARRTRMRITFLVGGVRSGKSTFAVEIGRRHEGPVVFVATAVPFDDDLRAARRTRIRPSGRRGRPWRRRSTSLRRITVASTATHS